VRVHQVRFAHDVLLPKDSEVLVEIGDPVVGSQTPMRG